MVEVVIMVQLVVEQEDIEILTLQKLLEVVEVVKQV